MHAIVLAWATHLNHVHDVLGVRILMLAQIQHFEFLPHWRVVPLGLNIAE